MDWMNNMSPERAKYIKARMKTALEKNYILDFDSKSSYFKEEVTLDAGGSGGGGFNWMQFVVGPDQGDIYKDVQEKMYINKRELFGKVFLIKDNIEPTKWVMTGESPTVFRYIDWILTVPLQMIEFYLILAAVTTVSVGVFNRLLVGTLVMLIGGYLGEAGVINAMLGFIIGMAGWIYILYEIFMGEAGQKSMSCGSVGAQMAFSACRMVVLVGWAIYPLGYLFGYLMGAVDAASLNLVYNLADFVNKIAFGVFIWAAAVADSQETA